MNRGEVWWSRVPPPPAGRGPHGPHLVLLLSWDTRYRFRDRVTVAPITTRIRGLDAEVFLDHNDGLRHGCVVNLDVLATIPRSVLDRRVVALGDARMKEVESAIHRALGMTLPCPVA